MVKVIKTTFLLRRGYDAAWRKNNPILATGEPGFVIDKNLLKIGDGVTPWNDLGYINDTAMFSAETLNDFPVKGAVDKIYRATKEKKIYQWNADENKYELLNSTDIDSDTLYQMVTEAVSKVLDEIVEEKLEQAEKRFDEKLEDFEKDLDEKLSKVESVARYDVFSKPEGTLVSLKQDEIRVMCPKNTVWTKQVNGADANKYYIGLKIYAPSEEIHSFKEDTKEFIEDQTMYYFENNSFAGVEENGRKFSIVWLPVALYNEETQSWTYYGEKSSTKKYVGWYYTVEWYDVNGKLVDTDSIRINLSNEDCHYNIEPYYMSTINANKLVQDFGDVLVLYGGSASENI